MNKLNLAAFGGHPFTSDDIEFEAAAVREALKGLSSITDGFNFSDKITILSGVAIFDSGTQFACVADGYISVGGEVFFVAAQAAQAKAVGGSYCVKIVETNETGGNVNYQNSTAQNTWKKRVATIAHDTSGLLVFDPNTVYWRVQVRQMLDNFNTWDYPNANSWSIPAFGSQYNISGLSAKDRFQFRVDAYGYLCFRGRLNGNGTAAQVIFTLAASINPGRYIHFQIPLYSFSNAVHSTAYGWINPSGQVQMMSGLPAGSYVLDFNQLRIAL